MVFDIAPHILVEAMKLAAEMIQSGLQSMKIRSTGLYVTVEQNSKPVIHRFECQGVRCYITMG